MFAWTAARFFEEIARHTPELASALPALDRGDVEAFYRAAKPVSASCPEIRTWASLTTLAAPARPARSTFSNGDKP